ncbi:MAG: M55 family metallopeptidase [Clostridia bacterium]
MRIYISADLEGISGVVHGDQVGSSGPDYGRTRKMLTREVNAAIAGAFDGGATEVVVNDGHGGMRNLLIEEIDRRARLLTGAPKMMGQMEGVDSEKGFAGLALIGYHARAGSQGVLNHTISGAVVSRLVLNGIEVGEAGMSAAIAAHYGIPLVFVSGDGAVCREVNELHPDVITVAVKEDAGRYAALSLPTEVAEEVIREGMADAVRATAAGDMPVPCAQSPATVELTTKDTAMADLAGLLPGSVRKDSLSLEYTADDVPAAYRALRAMIYLASCSSR